MQSWPGTPEPLVLVGDLSFESRHDFLRAAARAINTCDTELVVDCSALGSVDADAISLFGGLGRHIHQRTMCVTLVAPTPELCEGLERAELACYFQFRAV